MKQSDPNHQFIALAAHLFFACFVAGGVALFVGTQLSGIPQPTRWGVAMSASGLVGLLLTWNLQRTLYFIDLTLWRLIHMLPTESRPRKNASALEGLVAKVIYLTKQERPYQQYRTQQLQQVEEAAAQAVRNRLARDLHDSIKQQLFSIQISTAAAQARWEADAQGAQAALADVRQSTQAAMVEMDALLHQLAPNPLEKVGLVQALQEQCAALAYRTDADVQVDIGTLPDDDRFLPGTETAIFRVAQESLSNIARHARAKHITLQLNQSDDQSTILLTLTDDGQGFKPQVATQGMGLTNMRERTNALSGELTIQSKVDLGTTIQASFPLQETAVFKEQQIAQPNNRLNRFSLTALLGGFLAILALIYPVAVLLPARYVADWPRGTAVLGWVCIIIALFIYGGTGYVGVGQIKAKNWTQRVGWGAAAGGLAGSVSYIGLISAGMAVIGAQRILQHGVEPAASEIEFMWLLINDLAGIAWWTYFGFWFIVGMSMVLGAIGGLFTQNVEVVEHEESTKSLLAEPLFTAFVSSLFAFMMTTMLYYLLGDQMVQAAIEFLNYEPKSIPIFLPWATETNEVWPVLFPPLTPTILPIFSAATIYFLMMGGLWLSLRHNAQLDSWWQRRQTMIMAYLAAFLGGLVMLMLRMLLEQEDFLVAVGNAVILVLSLLYARTAVELEPYFQRESELPSSLEQWVFTLVVPTLILVYVASVVNWIGFGALLLLVTAVSIIFIPTRDFKSKQKIFRLPKLISISIPSILALALPLTTLLLSSLGMIHLIVKLIGPLSRYPGNDLEPLLVDFTVAGQVQSLFQMHITALLGTLFVATLLLGISMMVVKITDNKW